VIHKKNFKGKVIIGSIILVVIFAMVIIISFGELFHSNFNYKWGSDQTNIIQYLYPVSFCVQLAEQHQIEIDPTLKANLEKYTRKMFKKLLLDGLYSTQISQLIWLNDYYKLNNSEKLLSELNKFFIKDKNLFSFVKDEQRTTSMDKDMILITSEIFDDIKNNPENLKNFNIVKGLSDFLNHFDDEDIKYYQWGPVWKAASILIATGHKEAFDQNRIHQVIHDALKADLFRNLMNGQYEVNLAMIGTAESISEYMIYFENDTRYQYLSQEIYNKIITDDLVSYNKENSFFPLMLASIRDVKDLKENTFIFANYNTWLIENYHCSMENILIEALGK